MTKQLTDKDKLEELKGLALDFAKQVLKGQLLPQQSQVAVMGKILDKVIPNISATEATESENRKLTKLTRSELDEIVRKLRSADIQAPSPSVESREKTEEIQRPLIPVMSNPGQNLREKAFLEKYRKKKKVRGAPQAPPPLPNSELSDT